MRDDHGKGVCTDSRLRTVSAAQVCFTKHYPRQVTKLCSLNLLEQGAGLQPVGRGPPRGQLWQCYPEVKCLFPGEKCSPEGC